MRVFKLWQCFQAFFDICTSTLKVTFTSTTQTMITREVPTVLCFRKNHCLIHINIITGLKQWNLWPSLWYFCDSIEFHIIGLNPQNPSWPYVMLSKKCLFTAHCYVYRSVWFVAVSWFVSILSKGLVEKDAVWSIPERL